MSLTGDHTLGRPVNAGAGVPPTRLGENVQEWDRVADLPWAATFAMYTTPPEVESVPVRRRYDTRSLADVVRAVAA